MKDLYKVLFITGALIASQFMCYAVRTMQTDFKAQTAKLKQDFKSNRLNKEALLKILATAQNYYQRDPHNMELFVLIQRIKAELTQL